mmetsp:Transcript_15195/g.35607  ORF Transcript_15195/g.35607 Transcript_15195/m.35607 type:complete len:684 (+) Transcript_15195:74-2125(+)
MAEAEAEVRSSEGAQAVEDIDGDSRTSTVLPPLVASPAVPCVSRPAAEASSKQRPQPHRFVLETLTKLGSDSVRTELRLPPAVAQTQQEVESSEEQDLAPEKCAAPAALPEVGDVTLPFSKTSAVMPWWDAVDERGLLGPKGGRSWLVPHIKIDQLREAFREEASACVQALRQEAVDGTRAQISAQLQSWKEANDATLASVEVNVKELSELSSALKHFMSTVVPANLDAAKTLGKLEALKTELSEDALGVAERAAAKAVEACTSELNALANEYHSQFFKQREFFAIQEQHWYQLNEDMSSVRDLLQQIDGCTSRCEETVHAHELARQTSHLGLDGGVASILAQLQQMEQSVSSMETNLQATARDDAAAMREAMKRMLTVPSKTAEPHPAAEPAQLAGAAAATAAAPAAVAAPATDSKAVAEAGAEAGGLAEDPVTIVDLLCTVHGQVTSLIDTGRKDVEELREALAHERHRAEEEGAAAAQLRTKVHELDSSLAKQSAEMEDLTGRFTELQTLYSDAVTAPAAKVLRHIKDIEERGRVRIHRHTGDVELHAPLDFAAVPQNSTAAAPPDPEFKDESIATDILNDVAELAKLFDVGIGVEVHTKTVKGKEALWDKVASSRAEMVAERLVRAGVVADILVPQGLAGKQGAAEGLTIKIDKSIFPEWQELAGQRSQTKAKAAPRKK